MVYLRAAVDRGHADHGWLNSFHSFSFADYHDAAHMGISNLRVINDDTVAPGQGFATHGHENMEIVSYVLTGALEHEDSLGHGSVIRPGDVQRMSAGTGVTHSEYNASKTEPVRFLQIWLRPNRQGVEPSYAQQRFTDGERSGKLRLLVSPDGRNDSVSACQDAFLYGSLLDPGQCLSHQLESHRAGYVHVATGAVFVNGERLGEGDGARLDAGSDIRIEGADSADLLLFDLP